MPGLARELLEHLVHGAVPPARGGHDVDEVRAAQAVQLRRRERVHVHRRVGVRDRPQEREQQPDLGSRVEPGRPREPPRDPLEVERPEDRVRGRVRAHEDRHVAVRRTFAHPARDVRRDPVGLLGAGGERLVPDGGRPVAPPLRDELLDDPRPDLEAVRIVVADEPVRRVEDRAARPVVPAQHDDPGVPVPLAELEDVADRRAAELVDRLVVVAHHGHVAVRRGDQRDELRLRPVRVLELVHQHVPEARLHRAPVPPATRAGGAGRATPGRRSRWPRSPPAGAGTWRTLAPARAAGAPPPPVRPPRPGPPRSPRRRRPPRRPVAVAASAAQPLGVREVRIGRDVLVLGPREQRRERVEELRRDRPAAGTRRAPARTRARAGTRRSRGGTAPGRRSAGPSSSANSRTSRSPNAWNVEIAVSV